MKTVKNILFLAGLILIFNSCVSLKKYNELQTAHKNCTDENTGLKGKNLEFFTLVTEQAASLDKLKKQNEELIADTAQLGTKYRDLLRKYQDLSQSYDTLFDKNMALMKGNKFETQKLIAELEKTKESLQKKEDDLKKLESELDSKRSKLNDLQTSLDEKQLRLDELQSILNKKDSVVKALKNKVSEALLGYENKGLTVKQKNGKVYVSMEESLLFASGKYEVTAKGADALKKLAKVLEANADINIMVEGHTDNVPYKGTDQLLDNWDLSAKRATTVVRILLTNSGINPERITAAGRSEYVPVDKAKTPEARSKNRRTEIILTPKLDELLKIIESN
jgi:chemotaxis protein MotB